MLVNDGLMVASEFVATGCQLLPSGRATQMLSYAKEFPILIGRIESEGAELARYSNASSL